MKAEQANKEQHERAIADRLLESLDENDFVYLRHGIDGVEPDQLYLVAGCLVGIEVSTAFYEQRHAEGGWKFVNGKLPKDPSGLTSVYKSYRGGDGRFVQAESLDVLLQRSVQHELEDKFGKQYRNVDEAWLCIEVHAPLTEVCEIEQLIEHLVCPAQCPFSQVYLVFYTNSNDGGGFRAYNLAKFR